MIYIIYKMSIAIVIEGFYYEKRSFGSNFAKAEEMSLAYHFIILQDTRIYQ
jgi:hypothetical protein